MRYSNGHLQSSCSWCEAVGMSVERRIWGVVHMVQFW